MVILAILAVLASVMDRYYWFVLGSLAVWRVTHVLTVEDGPAQILVRIRRSLRNHRWRAIVDCFDCATVWVAVPFAAVIGSTTAERVLMWLALSGAACILERLSTRRGARAISWEGDNHHA